MRDLEVAAVGAPEEDGLFYGQLAPAHSAAELQIIIFGASFWNGYKMGGGGGVGA